MSGSVDTADILVVVDKGDQFNVNLQPPDQYGISINSGDTYIVNIDLPTTIVATQADTYYRVADYAVTASYISGSQNAGSGNGFPFSGVAVISGSLIVSGGIIEGTSSLTQQVIGGKSRYVPLWTGSSENELTSSIMYQTSKGIFIGYDTTPHFHSTEGETLAVHSGETGVKNVIYAHGTIDDDYRINLRNISSGPSASTNFKATADIGNDVGGFIEMGINSSTYARTDQIGDALDAYLYTTGSDLLIGTLSPDKRLIIFTGPGDADDNARVYVDSTGTVGINTNSITAGDPESLYVGALNTSSINLITAVSNVDNYSQINLTNQNAGTQASSDFVATANNGTETTNFINMGINSSDYAVPNAVGNANDAYLYSTGEMLHIGNATPGQHIMFFAGGDDAEANNKLILDANNDHKLSGSLNVTGSINVLPGVVNNLTASFALTASYVSGAASTWDTVSNKPANLISSSQQVKDFLPNGTVSSSTQATSWTVLSASFASTASNINFIPATASFATSASFAPTILPSGIVSSSTQVNYSQLQNIPSGIVSSSSQVTSLLPTGTVSSSLQINTGSFSGSFIGTFVGTSSISVTASRAITSSYVLPTGLPNGIISSSAQVITSLPSGVISSSAQINTGSFSGSFAGIFNGTSSWANNAVSSSFAPTNAGVISSSTQVNYSQLQNIPSGIVSSSAQINTGSFSGSITSASFATSASWAPTILPSGIVSSSLQINTGSFSGSFIGTFTGTASFANTSVTASYISGGVVIIGLPTDGAYGGSAGNVSGISTGDKAEDAFDKIEVILGKLAPAKPANLSARTLTTNATTYTAFSASGATPVSYTPVTANARPTASWTFAAATSGSGTTLTYDADAGTLQAEVDGVVSVASQDTLTTASDVGTFGNLIINQDLDPYNGTFGQQGFWKGFIASVAATQSLAVGPHTYRLLHSTTGNTPLFTWYLDNPTTPTITLVTGSSSGGSTRYVSGVPTLAAGETVIIVTSASNAISQFYNSTRIFSAVGNSSVAPSTNATLPASPPRSASVASASITLTVASNAFTSASTYTVTAYNAAGTTAVSTWIPPVSIRVDTISNESTRCRSGIGWYPAINSTVSGAGALWTASANLTGSRELQMTNNIYHYPSSSNYTANYPTPGPNYIGLVAETTSSFPGEAVRWVTFSGSLAAASNVSVVFNNTSNFTGIATTGSMRLYVLVSGSSPTNGWIDGATAYPGTGNPTNNGDSALVFGSSTTTTKIITFGSTTKTGVVFVRVGIPSSSLAGSNRTFSGVTITQV